MKNITKWRQNSSIKTVVVILALALGIGGGFFGLMSAVDMLRVRAEQTAEVSPADVSPSAIPINRGNQRESVSPADSVASSSETDSGTDEPEQGEKLTVLRNETMLIPQANPEPLEIPIIVTHDITLNDGRTVTTAYPAGEYSDITGVARSVISGETKLEVSFDRSVVSSQPGVWYYGHDLNIYLWGLTANYSRPWSYWFNGSVTVGFTDGSSINWPLGTASGDNKRYEGTFYWSAIADQVGERTVSSVTINQINAFPRPYSVWIVRHTGVPIKVESYDTQSAWDSFYPFELDQYGNTGLTEPRNVVNGVMSKQFAEGDTASSFKTYFMKGGKMIVSALDDSVDVTDVKVYDQSGNPLNSSNYVTVLDGKCIVTIAGNIMLDVITSDLSPHKVTAQVTSPDLCLHTVMVTDSYNWNSFYSDAYKLRFTDETCATTYSNGTQYPRNTVYPHTSEDGKTVTFSNYHRNQDVDYYMSLVCYDRPPDSYYNSNYDYAHVSHITVKFIRDDTQEDVTSQIPYRLDYKSGSPYVEFKPPAYDLTVKITQTQDDDLYTVTVKETRLSTKDTIWLSLLTSADSSKDSPIYVRGQSIQSGAYSCLYGNPARFPAGETTQTTELGYFRSGASYKYTLKDSGSTHWDNATMVQSVKFYNADTGAEVDIGLTYAGSADKDYYPNVGRTENRPVFNEALFSMPAFNLRIEVVFGKTIRAWNVKQQVVNSDGTASPAGNDFSVSFSGTPRDGDTAAFVYGTTADNQAPTDSFTIYGAANGCGVYRGTTSIRMTPAPADGYAVSYIRVTPLLFPSEDYGGNLARNGNTFTIPDSLFANDTSSGYRGPMYELTISYTKVASVRLVQRADGVPAPSSSTVVGTVRLSSQNNGTFVDPDNSTTNNLVKTYENKLFEGSETDGKIAKTSLVYASAGNKLTVKVSVNTGGSRVLSSVTVRRTNSDTPLDMTLSSSRYDTVEYKLNETLSDNDDITIEVEYMTANHIKMEVLEKNPDDQSSMITNTTSAYAEVTGSGAATEGRGYQFIQSSDRSVTCDSFTVRNTVTDYLTTGQTRLAIRIKDLPEGYVVANVETSYIQSNGLPGQHAEGLMPSSQNLDGYGICYDYSQCSINTAERNLYIRVYLAKTAEVTVRFRSRSDFDDAAFEDNTVSNSYATFEHSNSCYGSGTIYPVIVENDSGSKYNTSAYTVTNHPSERHVYAIDRVKMTGTISMPRNYTIAGVTATRSKDGATETLSPSLSGYSYKTENGVDVYQAKFALPDQLNNGYAYDVTVYIEKVTNISLTIYHSNEQGEFVLNTLTGSCAELRGARGENSGLYSGNIYQSSVPFRHSTQGGEAPTGTVAVNSSVPRQSYNVLRHTSFTLAIKPTSNDELYEVKAFEPDGDVYDCTYRETDEDGFLIYDVTQNGSSRLSEMNHDIAFEVYFTDKRTEGVVIVENRDYITGEILADVGNVRLSLANTLYTKPAKVLPDGENVGGTVAITDGSASYSVIAGTTTKLLAGGWPSHLKAGASPTTREIPSIMIPTANSASWRTRFCMPSGRLLSTMFSTR